MTEQLAHQIITKAIGGEVFVACLRDPTNGEITYTIGYTFGGDRSTKWLCQHRFQSVDQAEAGAITLADFLGARCRR